MGYTKRDLEQENFTACNSYLSKQITQVSEGKRLMTSAVVYDSNSDFPDGNIRSVYSSIGNTFSSMYSDNITDTIALGRCRFNTNNDEVTRTGTMGEILSELALTTPEETDTICSAIYHHDDKLVTDSPMDEVLKDADVIHHCMNDLSKAVKEKEQARFDALCKEFGM